MSDHFRLPVIFSQTDLKWSTSYLNFGNSVWKCNSFPNLMKIELSFVFHSVLALIISSSGCGNCGKLDVVCRVFQALWKQWENSGLVFPLFP